MAERTTFGDYIRAHRDRADLGLREAARALSISASYLSRLEANDYPPPSGEKLRRIASLYNCDINELIQLAQGRAHEVMAADTQVGPLMQQFYRLAQDQTPDIQEQMLVGAIGALKLSPEEKRKLLENLKAALSRSQGVDLPRRAYGQDGLFAYDVKPRILSRLQIEIIATQLLHKVFGSDVPLPVPIEKLVQRSGRNVVLVVHGEIEGGRTYGGDPAVLGLSRWSRDGVRRELVIHEDLFEAIDAPTRRRMNFTIGHELFHCLEHLALVVNRNAEGALNRSGAFASLSPSVTSGPWFNRKRRHKRMFSNEDWREWQANTFSGAILMPADHLRNSFLALMGTDQLVVDDGSKVEEMADQVARMTFANAHGCTTTLVEMFDVNPQAMAIRLMTLGLIKS